MTCRDRPRILALIVHLLPAVLLATTLFGGDFNGDEKLDAVFANRNSQHNRACLGDRDRAAMAGRGLDVKRKESTIFFYRPEPSNLAHFLHLGVAAGLILAAHNEAGAIAAPSRSRDV